MRSYCGVSRPVPLCPPPPPHCTAPSLLPPCPRPHSFPPHLLQAAIPQLTATAVPSRRNTPPLPTEPPPIKISPLGQPHPLTGQRAIRITPLAQLHLHTECQPIAVTHLLISTLYSDKLISLSFFLFSGFFSYFLNSLIPASLFECEWHCSTCWRRTVVSSHHSIS